MSVLSTGKPSIYIAKLDEHDNIGEWIQVDTPKDGTTSLATEAGDSTKYQQEGKGIVDMEVGDSGYTFTFDLFVKKGFQKPIKDVNGVIVDNYAVRLSPKDKKATGFIIYKAQVSCVTSFAVADGMICQYQFTGLQTDDHENVMDFWVEADQLVTDVNYLDLDATAGSGESITGTITCTLATGETVTATDDADWITTSVSDGVVTVTATANTATGAKRREAWVDLTSSTGKTAEIRVNQEAGSAS